MASTRSGTTPAHDWANYPDLITAFARRLGGVVIENRPAVDVLRQHDAPEVLHYADPPYPYETRNARWAGKAYRFEMSEGDHREFAAALHQLRGMVVVSGYPCALYDDLFGDWRRVQRQSMSDGARPRTECLWLNLAAVRTLEQENHQLTLLEMT